MRLLHISLKTTHSECKPSSSISSFTHSLQVFLLYPHISHLPPPHFYSLTCPNHLNLPHLYITLHYQHFKRHLHLKWPVVHQQLHVIRNTAHRPSMQASYTASQVRPKRKISCAAAQIAALSAISFPRWRHMSLTSYWGQQRMSLTSYPGLTTSATHPLNPQNTVQIHTALSYPSATPHTSISPSSVPSSPDFAYLSLSSPRFQSQMSMHSGHKPYIPCPLCDMMHHELLG